MLASMLDKHVAPLLSSSGFHRTKLVWNRRLNGMTHVLDIQLSNGCIAEDCSFTVNLGVFFERVWQAVWDKPVARTIQEVECFPRLRISRLIGKGTFHKDVWWNLEAITDVDVVGSELQDILISKGLPFLDSLDSINAALTVAEDPMLHRFPAERLYYAAMKCVAGRYDDANEILTEMLENPKLHAWHNRVRGVSERLACM
ncbi:MAG: DUF4304 domain-containing protein [Phycisphaerae bacterium]